MFSEIQHDGYAICTEEYVAPNVFDSRIYDVSNPFPFRVVHDPFDLF